MNPSDLHWNGAPRRRIAVLAHGSRGDIQPLLAVASELVQRGHQVRMTVNTNLVSWARRAGVEIVPMELDGEALLTSERGKELLATGKLATFLRALADAEFAANSEMVGACVEAARDADLLLSTALTAYRGSCIAERFGVPQFAVAMFPYQDTRRWASFVSPIRDFGFGWLNQATFSLMHQLMWHTSRRAIADMRRMLALPALRARPRIEALPSVNLYSDVLFPGVEWGPDHQLAGFCQLSPRLREQLGEAQLPAGLSAWLDAGPAPVFFGFGSMPVLDPERLLGWVAELTQARGQRALVGSGWTDYSRFASPLPDHVFVAPTFDHDRMLPRCVAAIHHGGAGTTAAALRAGLPCAVLSVFGDQPFWGWRIAELGLGVTLKFQALSRERLARCLDRLLLDDVRARARAVAERLASENGASRAADIVERWAQALGDKRGQGLRASN